MWRTRVGYAGGTKESPTYSAIGDHSECVEVDFDPDVISYEELLEVFWQSHDASARPFSSQYASLILAHDEEQLAAASASAVRYERASGNEVLTRIETLERFYPAEDYHQKHDLRGDRAFMAEFEAMYPDGAGFRDSTAAARMNGFLAGYGSAELLVQEVESYGLTDEGRERVDDELGTSAAACPVPVP